MLTCKKQEKLITNRRISELSLSPDPMIQSLKLHMYSTFQDSGLNSLEKIVTQTPKMTE